MASMDCFVSPLGGCPSDLSSTSHQSAPSSILVSEWLAHKLIRQYLEGFSENSWPAVVKWTFVLGVLALRNSNLPVHKLSVNDLVDIVNQNGYSTMTPAQRLAPLQWAAGAASSSSVSCLASSHQQTQCEPNKRDFSSSSPFCRPSSSSSSSSHVDIADGDRRGRTARSVSFDSPAAPERKHASSCSSSPVLARGRLRHQQRRVSFKPSGLTPDDCFDFVLKSAAKKPSSDWRSGDSSTFLPAKRIEDLHYPSGMSPSLSPPPSSLTYPSWWGDGPPASFPQCTYFPKRGFLVQKDRAKGGRTGRSAFHGSTCGEQEEEEEDKRDELEEEERASCLSVATPKFGAPQASYPGTVFNGVGKENQQNGVLASFSSAFSPPRAAPSSSASLVRGPGPHKADQTCNKTMRKTMSEESFDATSLPSFGLPSASPTDNGKRAQKDAESNGKNKQSDAAPGDSFPGARHGGKNGVVSCKGNSGRVAQLRARGELGFGAKAASQRQRLLLRRRNLHRSPAPKEPPVPPRIDGFQSFRPTSEAQWVCTLRPSSHQHIKNPSLSSLPPRPPPLPASSVSSRMNAFRQFAWGRGDSRCPGGRGEGWVCRLSPDGGEEEGGGGREREALLMRRDFLGNHGVINGGGAEIFSFLGDDGDDDRLSVCGKSDASTDKQEQRNGVGRERDEDCVRIRARTRGVAETEGGVLSCSRREGEKAGRSLGLRDKATRRPASPSSSARDAKSVHWSLGGSSGCSSYFQAALAAYADERLEPRGKGGMMMTCTPRESTGVHSPSRCRPGDGGYAGEHFCGRKQKHHSLHDSREYLMNHPSDLALFPDALSSRAHAAGRERLFVRETDPPPFPPPPPPFSQPPMLFEQSPYSLGSYCYAASEYSNFSSPCSDSLSSLSFEPLRRLPRHPPRSEATRKPRHPHSVGEKNHTTSPSPGEELRSGEHTISSRGRRASEKCRGGDGLLSISTSHEGDSPRRSLENEEQSPAAPGGGGVHHVESVEEAALRDSNLALSTSLVSDSSSPLNTCLQHASLGSGGGRDEEERREEGSVWGSEEASAVQDLIEMYWDSDSSTQKKPLSSPRICADHPREGGRKLGCHHSDSHTDEESSYFEKTTHASCLPDSMGPPDEEDGPCPSSVSPGASPA